MDVAAVPAHITGILRSLERGGHSAYLVGGCVRDMLLGRRIHDWDISASASAGEILALFPGSVLTGGKYGTVTVVTDSGCAEVTPYRSEGGYSDGRHPDSVTFLSDPTEDLSRRDFTVNAMAMSADGALLDPFSGRRDLDARVIRCVGDAETRFCEDALRIFRALRFSAELLFEIEPATLAAAVDAAPLARLISAERIAAETGKILLTQRPELLGLGVSMGLYERFFTRADVPAEKLARLSAMPADACLRWSAALAVLMECSASADAAASLRALRLARRLVLLCPRAAELALKNALENDVGVRRVLALYGEETALCAAAASDALRGAGTLGMTQAIIDGGCYCAPGSLAINGADVVSLGFRGREVGAVLSRLIERVAQKPGDNRRDALLALARTYAGEAEEKISSVK